MVFWASIQRKTDIPSFHSLPEYEFHLIFREGNIHSMIEFMSDRRITSIPSVLWRNEWMEDTWMGDTERYKNEWMIREGRREKPFQEHDKEFWIEELV